MKAIYVIPAALSLLVPALAQAELKWEKTTVELSPGVAEKQAIGHFKYENTGKEPVRFKSVKASCGCTTAQTQKDEVAPGEKGEITATFNIGDRTGVQTKTVSVETEPGGMITLTLKTNIPSVLELMPNFVFWQANEKPEAKTIIAKVGKDVPVKDIEVTSLNNQFDAKVDKGPGEGQFRITIAPKATTTPAFATVTVKTDYPKEAPKTYYITARVAAPAPAAVNNPPAPVVAASPNPGS
ncbi:MAG TPA: DUF1573 domain-containing protein [Chthoniobacterales bacterium]|nr:DUF1573 domain-containing protein [Chthoniobacterales bacterium]